METGSPAPAPVTAPAAPVLTRTEVPPPEQQAAFPATLLAVPTLPAPARPALAELAALPAAWLPIIAADQAEQRQTRSNLPHSDAYLAGQPSKRRRLNAVILCLRFALLMSWVAMTELVIPSRSPSPLQAGWGRWWSRRFRRRSSRLGWRRDRGLASSLPRTPVSSTPWSRWSDRPSR